MRTALVTPRDKFRTLFARGAAVELCAENFSAEYLRLVGKDENVYLPDVTSWSLRAGRHVLKQEGVDLMYLSTTEHMMRGYAAEEAPCLEHLHRLDRYLGDIVADHPRLGVYWTADHGINPRSEAIDPALCLRANSISAVAAAIIPDRHQVHQRSLGGAFCVYLDRRSNSIKALGLLKDTAGVEEVHTAPNAVRRFYLHPQRIWDLFLLAAKDSVFDELEQPCEVIRVRSHGLRRESAVTLIASGGKVGWRKCPYSVGLPGSWWVIPLPSKPMLAQSYSPSRVCFAAQTARALDWSGRLGRTHLIRGKGDMGSAPGVPAREHDSAGTGRFGIIPGTSGSRRVSRGAARREG